MILTHKLKHDRDFSTELEQARKVAQHAIRHRSTSSADVRHIGLKSAISNQILRKYARNKKAKSVKNINLTIPGQSIKFDETNKEICVPCLKLRVDGAHVPTFEKINQIEVGKEYAYVSVSVPEAPQINVETCIGVDRNTTGHVAVVANVQTGHVTKLGKKCLHIHKKYSQMRRKLQMKGKHNALKKTKKREQRIVRDTNHKISRKIVEMARQQHAVIKLENLSGIRNNKKHTRSFNYSLNSWSFYQLQQFIEYKAKLQGIPVAYVDPAYTSQRCSRCGTLGNRNGKEFSCPACGHVDHADVNAAFNIALAQDVNQSVIEKDMAEGSTDAPHMAMA
jgi:putative transposase